MRISGAFLCNLLLLSLCLCVMMNTTEETVAERVGFPTLSCLSFSFCGNMSDGFIVST